jgi:hypothetical protein
VAIRFADGTRVPVHVSADVLKAKTAAQLVAWSMDSMRRRATSSVISRRSRI